MNKIIVIGAGASGVIAALKASEKNEVILVDSNDKICKKVLLTGNGHCNYWNSNISIDKYNTDDFSSLEKIISNKQEVYNYLESLGIYPRIKNGYYYPYSNNSFSIKEIFEKELIKRNIQIYYNFKVTNIEYKYDEYYVTNDIDTIKADKVILASGLKACPKTGSDGNLLPLLKKMNFNINEINPGLVQLKSNENYLKELNGIRVDAIANLYINDEKIKEEEGEVQFTDYGISGICILNLSNIISRNKSKKINIKLNLVPFTTNTSLWLSKRCSLLKDNNISEVLESILHYKITESILKKCKINPKEYFLDLNIDKQNLLTNTLSNFNVSIIGTNDFDKAQVSTGGISLKEIHSDSMESKKNKGLFIVGEQLDVDGICGGFNLAFAFISGYIAGKNI